LRSTKPSFEYIDFVQPVQVPQKNINKFNELEHLLAIEGFIQPSNEWLMTAEGHSNPVPERGSIGIMCTAWRKMNHGLEIL
jgi:hypothetical protein